MNKINILCSGAVLVAGILTGCIQSKVDEDQSVGKYSMPDERGKHEGTWLQWPHNLTYGKGYKEEVESIWIEMTSALSEGENIHIIAYDEYEKNYINDLLYEKGMNMDKIDFYIIPTNDVWARDSAPIFVYDKDKNIKTLMNAKNADGKPYQHVYLPISKNNVILDNGKDLGYKGSYINFYIGNTVVLVPNYNDPNDKIANDRIQKLYPDRKVIGIDVRELYKNGGMIHCVTQQQPVSLK